MNTDPSLLTVPVKGPITSNLFFMYLDLIGLPPYEQRTVSEYSNTRTCADASSGLVAGSERGTASSVVHCKCVRGQIMY